MATSISSTGARSASAGGPRTSPLTTSKLRPSLHPDVKECAAVGVPSEFEGDDDIKLCVILREGAQMSPEALMVHLTKRLPHFMTPRYIGFVSEFAHIRRQGAEGVAARRP